MSIQYAGGTNVNAVFTGNVKNDILTNVYNQLVTAGWSVVTGNIPSTVTMTIASPGVVSWTAHGLTAGTQIRFQTTGALPTGVTANTTYYVISAGLTANAFEFSASFGGAAVNTSGAQSGVHTCVPEVLLASATTPWSVTTRIRFRDNGTGSNCVTFSIENSTSSAGGANNTTNGQYLLPVAGKTFRVVANKYQAWIFQPAASGNRSFVAFGTPYLPTFLQGVITECGWLIGNAYNDSTAAVYPSFRTGFCHTTSNNQSDANTQTIVNTNVLDIGNSSNLVSTPQIMIGAAQLPRGVPGGQTGMHWHDGSALMLEPLIAWPTSSTGGEPLIRGQLWDSVVIQDTFAGDTTTTFDSHNWIALTDTDSSDRATLFLVTP
jgi:hypothetical protein